MRLATRSIALAVVVSLLLSGPLATFAHAQQAAPPPAEQPAPQTMQPGQPAEPAQAAPLPLPQPGAESSQAPPPPAPQPAAEPAQAAPPLPQPAAEPAQVAPSPAPQPAQMPAPPPAQPPQAMQETVRFEEPSESSTAWYVLGATIANVVFIPGKAVTCVLGMLVGGGLLLVTLGAGYKGSVAFAKEGCGGRWALKANDLRGTEWVLGSGERPD